MWRFLKTTLKSLRLYLIIMFPSRRLHLRINRRSDILLTEYQLRSGPWTLKPDIYRRRGRAPHRRPAIIIYVPLAQEGKRNRLVMNFMEGLAHLGYVVMVPFWPDRPPDTMASTDADDFRACLDWLHNQSDVDPKRIGVVAVSYGVGAVIKVASDPKAKTLIQFICAIGGYADLVNVAQFALTGTFAYQGIVGQLPPDPRLLPFVFRNILPWAKTDADRKFFARAAERGQIDLNDQSTQRLSPTGHNLLAFLTAATPEAMAGAVADLPTAMQAWLADLAPMSHLAKIKTPLLILHSTNDQLVPYTESLRLYAAVKQHRSASLTLVNVFDHTVPVPATPINLFRIYLPNLWRVVRYIYRMLAFQEE